MIFDNFSCNAFKQRCNFFLKLKHDRDRLVQPLCYIRETCDAIDDEQNMKIKLYIMDHASRHEKQIEFIRR